MISGVAVALLVDVIAVLAFAVVGRGSHAEGLGVVGVLGTAAPFLVGVLVGWAAGRVWRAPVRWPAGLWVFGAAVVLGLALRGLVTGRLPVTFMLVTAVSLAVLLIGWRVVAAAVLRSRSRPVERTRRPSI